jgi:hypothetical protein
VIKDRTVGDRCNIGPAELARRRRVATSISFGTVVFAGFLVGLAVPHLARLLVWPFAAGSAVAWLQVTNRFCVRFGATGVENFGALGAERQVARSVAEADRRRALRLILQGIVAGAVVAVVFAYLPL